MPRTLSSTFTPGLRGPVQLADHRLVDQRVHLEDEVRLAPGLGVGDLAVDAVGDALAQVHGRDQELAVLGRLPAARQVVEHQVGVGADVVVGGEVAEVGVLLGRDAVVVARAEVRVAADAVALAAHDLERLAVRLEADEAVDHVGALALQRLGPADVALLVEARLELDEDGDVLAVGRRLHELLDGRRVATAAVQRLLDGQHVRIVGGGAQELDHRVERVVGMVEQHVAVADGGEELGSFEPRERRRDRLHERGVLELGPVDGAGAPEAAEAEGRAHRVDVGLAQLEVLAQDVAHALRHRLVDGDADDGAEAAPADELLDGLEEVVGLQLLDGELGVARHAERVRLQHLHAGEQRREVGGDDLLEPGEPLVLHAVLVLGARSPAGRRARGAAANPAP